MKKGIKKQPVEIYKHYTLYIVAGMNPAFFIAEKDNPAKGVTLTADNLDELKKNIDKTLDYAAKVKINIWEGPERNGFLPNGFVRINSNGVNFNGFAIIVTCDYDIDTIIEMAAKRPLRVSKKYRKTNKHVNLAKFFKHNSTVHQR